MWTAVANLHFLTDDLADERKMKDAKLLYDLADEKPPKPSRLRCCQFNNAVVPLALSP